MHPLYLDNQTNALTLDQFSRHNCFFLSRYLDTVSSQQQTEDPRKVQKHKDQAEKDNQKLMKNFKKVQKRADKMKAKNEEDVVEEIKQMEISDGATKRRGSLAPIAAQAQGDQKHF